LEELLETLHCLKTGENFVNHHLDKLWEKISWNQPDNQQFPLEKS
jgi:hypothetical protein